MEVPARGGQGLHLWPTTAWGRSAVGFAAAFVVLMAAFLILVASGQRGGATLSSNLTLAIPGLLAAASGVVALVTGLIGIFFRHERSMLAFVATVIGALVTVFVVGEFAFPH